MAEDTKRRVKDGTGPGCWVLGERCWGIVFVIRGADKWLLGYLASALRRPGTADRPVHVMLCIADHFEPLRREITPDGSASGGRSSGEASKIVGDWCDRYRKSVVGVAGADGIPPRHTFFYPQDEYDEGCLEILAGLCREGLGEIEIQIHHRNDTAGGLRNKLAEYRDVLHGEHGALGVDRAGNVRFGFVHGNWCLCNSRPDGDWCGVNDELAVLAESGCYADFTFPSAPSPTQPGTVNTIYRASDNSGHPRGHEGGERLRVSSGPGTGPQEGPQQAGLVLVPGPLGLDWRRRKFGVLPRLDTGEISGVNPPTRGRAELWVRQHIHVEGRPDWVFVKLYTHGCVDVNAAALFGVGMREAHSCLVGGDRRRLHYVAAREMYNIVRAAEDGCEGDPAGFRDYEITAPHF